jgi:3',5'-cyclic AMP phosphodiesterase CpdA
VRPAGRLAACLAACAVAARAADEGFWFVQLTDLHLSGGTDHVQRVSAAIDAVNDLPVPVAFVLVSGDLVNDNLDNSNVLARTTGLLGRLRPPVHVLAGNHDILGKRWGETTSAWTRAFGPLATNFTHGGVTFLLLFDETLCDPALGAAHPDYDAAAWTSNRLEEARGRPVIVVHHRPATDDYHTGAFRPGWPEAARERWSALLNRYGVAAAITGHYHRDELQWLGSVPVYASAPLAGYYGRQASFRLYEWRHGRLAYRTVYLR